MAMAMSAAEAHAAAAEAHAAAAEEGLALVPAENPTGFWNVGLSKRASKPFQAKLWQDGRCMTLGYFATAEEAALAVARFLGPERVAAALAAATAKALEPAPMTAAEAHAAAAAEGLTLVCSENKTGFKGVTLGGNPSKPFMANLWLGGCHKSLGIFATAEEAALAVARFHGPEVIAAEQAAPRDAIGRRLPAASSAAPMTAAEAHAAAASEGLALVRAGNSTGFKHVSHNNAGGKPFQAQLKRGGRNNHLGVFATAEEAALAVARFLGPEGVAAALAPPVPAAPKPTMTATEAHAAAAAEGLSLLGANNATGFKGVSRSISRAGKPFQAAMWHGGRLEYLGTYETAEQAALAVARFLGPAGVAAALAPPLPEHTPLTAAEARAAAAEEGLALVRSENATGFKGVSRNPNCVNKPFKANLRHGGRLNHLGHFATAEQAALAFARALGPSGVAAALAPEPAPMTAAEAHAAAAEEGSTLVRAENATGYKGVLQSKNVSKPFVASLSHGGRTKHLGTFATAEEAALAVSRFRSAGAAAEEAALAVARFLESEPAPMTAAEAHATAAAEGLTLLRGERADNSTGFKGVSMSSDSVSKPFKAQLRQGGRNKNLGVFATAEEAALTVARARGPAGAAAPPGRKRPAASGAGPSEPSSKRGKQPADDDEEAYVVKAEAVSDDDAPTPLAPAPPVLCYCERPAALLDGRWVCAQLVEGDFCILGREDE